MFLDRDGVLSRSLIRDGRPYAPLTLEDFTILPEARAVLDRLKEAGFLSIVVTNQPDVGRGDLSEEILAEMHDRLRAELPLDDIFVCTCHENDGNCACYKPRPDMLLAAAKKWRVVLDRSFMVGDRWRDIGAGRAAGCRTVFIERGYANDPKPESPDVVVASLDEACEFILRQSTKLGGGRCEIDQ